jgi:hypothetical protein
MATQLLGSSHDDDNKFDMKSVLDALKQTLHRDPTRHLLPLRAHARAYTNAEAPTLPLRALGGCLCHQIWRDDLKSRRIVCENVL